MRGRQNHRALRKIVWGSRALGWILVALAILNIPQIGAMTRLGGGFRLVSSVALVLLGIAWLAVLELFLHFFDRYLSNN
jgi:hypothetical protein